MTRIKFNVSEENDKLKKEIQELQRNLDEVKSEVTIKEVTKNDEIEELYQKYQTEVSSLRQLMNSKYIYIYVCVCVCVYIYSMICLAILTLYIYLLSNLS